MAGSGGSDVELRRLGATATRAATATPPGGECRVTSPVGVRIIRRGPHTALPSETDVYPVALAEQTSGRDEEAPSTAGDSNLPERHERREAASAEDLNAWATRKQKVVGILEKKIIELLEFVKPRHNVHGEIKKLAHEIRTCFNEVVAVLEREPSVTAKEPEETVNEVSSKKKNPKNPKGKGKTTGMVGLPRVEESHTSQRTPPESNEAPGSQWKTVEPRRKKPSHSIPKHRDALVVRASESGTYADILRRMKQAPELEELGRNVVKIRKRGTGDLLFEMGPASGSKAAQFQTAVAEQLKGIAEVKTLSTEVLLEIKDMDEVTTEKEIVEAFERHLEAAKERKVVVKSLRTAYGGTQTAVIALPADLARKAVQLDKIKIGWVRCRIREKIVATRCYRCWAFGHLARNCKGPDRSKNCHRCGEGGHIARTCTKTPNCCLCQGKDGEPHATGSYKCPYYQEAIKKVERGKKE